MKLLKKFFGRFSQTPTSSVEDYNGTGTLTLPDGTKYFGEFKEGIPNGSGTLTFPGGGMYVGEFKNGQMNGAGTRTFPNGESYVGEFKDGDCNGTGIYTFPDGGKYVGEFKNSERNGTGTLTFPDGEMYVGEFKDDKYNGIGTFTYPNGEKYVGEFKNNKYNGIGTLTFSDGNKYEGEFIDAIFPNGDILALEYPDTLVTHPGGSILHDMKVIAYPDYEGTLGDILNCYCAIANDHGWTNEAIHSIISEVLLNCEAAHLSELHRIPIVPNDFKIVKPCIFRKIQR